MTITTEQNPMGEWTAYDSDTYDCDWDSERGYFSRSPMGYGKTKEAAIADLMAEIEER